MIGLNAPMVPPGFFAIALFGREAGADAPERRELGTEIIDNQAVPADCGHPKAARPIKHLSRAVPGDPLSMTILLINPNTSASVTARLATEARRVAEPGVTIRAITAPFGVPAIQTPDELRVAADAVLATMAANSDCDAAIIGAFGDPGLDEARAAMPMPVFGLGESGILAASANGRRFAVVTVGEAMRGDIMRKIESLGLADRLVALQFLVASVADVVRDRAALIPSVVDAVRDCASRHHAEAVLLGGGPFVGLAHEVSEKTSLPVLDGLHAAIALATKVAMRTQPAASSPR